MKVIRHLSVVQNSNTGKSLQAAHELDKTLRLERPMARGLENKAALNHPGNAVIKTLTLSLDPWDTHRIGAKCTQNKIKKYQYCIAAVEFLACPHRMTHC